MLNSFSNRNIGNLSVIISDASERPSIDLTVFNDFVP